jgi:hypothetical protein
MGGPTTIHGNFNVSSNLLVSLIGGPQVVDGDYWISGTPLTSLVGAPDSIGGDFACVNTPILSIEGIPRHINGDIFLQNCRQLHSFENIQKHILSMDGFIYMEYTEITSNILGLFLIKGFKGIRGNQPSYTLELMHIVNRHLIKGRAGMLSCQQELIESGHFELAQI